MFLRTVIVMLSFCSVGYSTDLAGVLSSVSGSVKIVRAGETAPQGARTADLIFVGDRVLTGPQSAAAFVFCPGLRSARILDAAEVQFNADTLQIRKGKLSDDRSIPSCHLPSNLSLTPSSQLQSGLLRLRGSDLTLLAPSRTNIAGLQPLFRWDPVEGADTYVVKLMDREERVIWSQTANSIRVEYPSSAPMLRWDQKYWWRVTARKGAETLTEAGTFFQILPKESADRVRSADERLQAATRDNQADVNVLILRAFLYEENGMLDEAARLYSNITLRIGSENWVQSRLVEAMNKLGWNKLEQARR